MNRRKFLKLAGMGTGMTLAPKKLWAASNSPKRLVIFFTQHGSWYDGWKMRQGNNQPENRSWNMDLPTLPSEFSEALYPLARFREQMVVVDGLALVSAEVDGSGLRHELGQVHALTGANIELLSGVPLASQPSLDQIIAGHIANAGQFKSLEFGIGDPPITINYSGAKQLLPMTLNPLSAHQRLFGITGEENGITAQLMARQSQLMAATAQRYSKLAQNLGNESRIKLQTHRDLLADLGTRIDGLASLRQQCETRPEQPFGPGTYDEDYDAFCHLVTAALSCDLSRVITLHMGQLDGMQVTGTAIDVHNDYAHAVWLNETAQQIMTQYTAVHSDHLAKLAGMLKSIIDPLGDGSQTLLDNTMILWVNELGDGSHGFEKWPAVILGGNAFSGFNYGKYIYHPSDTPEAGWSYLGNLQGMGRPHQHLLVGVAQAFGLSQNHIGEKKLILSDGTSFDCTGPLEGLS